MKIVNLEKFRELPAGIIFAKYDPCVFRELRIKGDTWEVDFLEAGLLWVDCTSGTNMEEILTDAEHKGTSFKLDPECYGRDGMFEKDQLFAVYEKEDIQQLVSLLNKSLLTTIVA